MSEQALCGHATPVKYIPIQLQTHIRFAKLRLLPHLIPKIIENFISFKGNIYVIQVRGLRQSFKMRDLMVKRGLEQVKRLTVTLVMM